MFADKIISFNSLQNESVILKVCKVTKNVAFKSLHVNTQTTKGKKFLKPNFFNALLKKFCKIQKVPGFSHLKTLL